MEKYIFLTFECGANIRLLDVGYLLEPFPIRRIGFFRDLLRFSNFTELLYPNVVT